MPEDASKNDILTEAEYNLALKKRGLKVTRRTNTALHLLGSYDLIYQPAGEERVAELPKIFAVIKYVKLTAENKAEIMAVLTAERTRLERMNQKTNEEKALLADPAPEPEP